MYRTRVTLPATAITIPSRRVVARASPRAGLRQESTAEDSSPQRLQWTTASFDYGVGRGRGVGLGRGDGMCLGVGLGRGVTVGVTEGVAVDIGVTEGVGVAVALGVGVGVGVGSGPEGVITNGPLVEELFWKRTSLATTRTRTSSMPDDGGSCQS